MRARPEYGTDSVGRLGQAWPPRFLTLLLPLLLCVGCIPIPMGAATATPLTRTASEGPVSFAYSAALAEGVSAERVPSVTLEQAGGMGYAVVPDHSAFVFVGSYAEGQSLYRQTINLSTTPQILIFEIQRFEALSPLAAERIAELKALLRERPAEPLDEIPLLPAPNGQQMFRVKVAYLDFLGGAGVRFVTQYAQEARHVNNQEIFYTFQGVTSDGRYYVAASFPVMCEILPAGNANKQDGSDAPQFRDETNQATMIPRLEVLPDDDYAPDLAVLDALIRSIKIE